MNKLFIYFISENNPDAALEESKDEKSNEDTTFPLSLCFPTIQTDPNLPLYMGICTTKTYA